MRSFGTLGAIIPRIPSRNDTDSLGDCTSSSSVRMKVVTICIPESYIEGLDKLINQSKYPNRSEIIRIAIRDLLVDELWGQRKRQDDLPLIVQLEQLSSTPQATMDADSP
jgi:antitoxin ParD1/3/4